MKRGIWQFVAGFAAGAILFGGSIAYAAGVTATPAANRILADGREIKAEAYIIEGRNYLQLRDLAAAIDFSVVWDEANGQALIDTSRGYEPNETLPAPAQSSITPDTTPAQAVASTMTIGEMKAEIIRLTNAERVKAGVPELEVLPALMDTAQAKAEDLRANHYYGHHSPVYGTLGEMIKAAIPAAKSCAENLAPWTTTAVEAFAGWMDSPEHRAHILASKYTHIGVGIIKGTNGGYWWVQQFVTL